MPPTERLLAVGVFVAMLYRLWRTSVKFSYYQ